MKLLNSVMVIMKLILSIAGVIYVINRVYDSLYDDQYKFEVDSFLNNDEKKAKPQSRVVRDSHTRYPRNAAYESMDT